jgi:hypothetical protein
VFLDEKISFLKLICLNFNIVRDFGFVLHVSISCIIFDKHDTLVCVSI